MAKRTPQTFQKLQRERKKQLKRQEKAERKLDRQDAKRDRQTEVVDAEGNPIGDGEQDEPRPEGEPMYEDEPS